MVSDELCANLGMTFYDYVLILVVMEYGLRRSTQMGNIACISLNPCCNGIWSQTISYKSAAKVRQYVLILVVMEYGLRP